MEFKSVLSDLEAEDRLRKFGKPRRLPPPQRLIFADGLVEAAEVHLQRNGAEELEELVLWAGYQAEQCIYLASLLCPSTIATWGNVRIVRSDQPKIADWLRNRGQLLYGEMHTHRGFGGLATELSDEDRRAPVSRQPGFLTVIIPGYAARGIDFRHAGLWEFLPPRWRRLASSEMNERIAVITDEEMRNALR